MKCLITLLLFATLFSSPLTHSQNHSNLIFNNGKEFKETEEYRLIKYSPPNRDMQIQNLSPRIYYSTLGVLDTLSNINMWSDPEATFGFYGQDVLMQWYIAPANMTIKAVGYKTINAAPDGSTINVKIFKLNPWWNFQQLSDADIKQWGYFPAIGDGFNEVTPFLNEATGPFQDLSGLSCPGILDSYLWSQIDSSGYNTTPVSGQYTWVEMNVMGYEPTVNKGDIVVIVLQNNSTIMSSDPNSSDSQIQISTNTAPAIIGYNEFKFYESGRFGLDNGVGWWSLEYDFNIVLVTDITGDRPPIIESLTDIPDTIFTSSIDVEAVVSDDNPSGGSSGVSSVKLYYETNTTPLDSVLMTNIGGNIYSGSIPGQSAITVVTYYVRATDVEGNTSLPFGFQYTIKNFNDFYYYIQRNRIKMWVSNNGDGSHDPINSNNGFYWPIDITDTTQAIYEDGLVWGGYQDGNLKVGGSTYLHGLQAGKIISTGVPSDPNSSQYRVYRIRKDWESLPPGPLRDTLETDYNEWPCGDGAPCVGGVPEFVGDEILWYVANDLDATRTQNLYGSDPMGIEMQVTTFAYDSTNDLADIVFKKYKLINKSGSTINDMYLSYWSDPDLGDATDDFIGCDTLLNLGYTYNANDYDTRYGSPPPSVGYNLLRGPIVPAASNQLGFLNGTWRRGYKNLDMTSFVAGISGDVNFSDPPLSIYEGTTRTYSMIQGLDRNGNQIINPQTGLITKYCFPGDPVTGNGWTNQDNYNLADKRHYISMGPFNFADADTQEVIIAILIDKGTDRLNSITELKNKDEFVQEFYYDHFLTPIPDFEIQCNMSNQIREGAFDPAVDQLKVMANFNGWAGDFLTDADNDSIYSFTLYNVEFDSLLEFKFWTTPDRWEAFPERRMVEVGESPGGYYEFFNDDSVYTPPKDIIVNYRCDMAIEIQFGRFNPATDQVKLMGYQYWWGTGVDMINNGSNVYEFTDTLSLGVNDYIPGYKFFYTPDTWEGGDNKTYQINQGDYDFGEITLYRYFNQEELPSVEFQCDMTVQILEGNFNPSTDQVQVRGNFNGWSGTELTDPDGDWIYTNHIFNFEIDSHLVYKYWHSADTWEGDPNREYTVVAGYQALYDYFNRDDDPTNGERLWDVQNSNTGNTLMEVGFVDDTKGWIVGNAGMIIHTTNGGDDWVNQTSNSNQSLWSVSFIDENAVWAIGTLGTILKTTDGGNNWNTISGITTQPLREVFFIDVNTGWVCGAMGTIIKTTDGGISWNAQTTNTTFRFQSIYFVDANIGWAVGEGGMIMHTTDGGQVWTAQTSNTTNYLLDVHFENASVGWVTGWEATILKTTDSGNSWTLQNAKLPPSGNRNDFYNIWFTDLLQGWAVARYGTIRYTSDGGTNWLPQYSGTTQDLFGVMFPGNQIGWAVGGNGTILKYSSQDETPDQWLVDLGVSDAGGSDASNQLVFGQNINATDGIDVSLGEEEIPPPPPSGIFDVRFILPDPTIATLIDFRNSLKTKIDWQINFQPGSAGYPITFSWDIDQLPSGSFWLKDLLDGTIVNIDMSTQNSYALTNEGINSLKIEFRKQACGNIDLMSGWNMISIPFELENANKTYLFPSATSNAFGYENQYVVCDSIETGNGYWLRFSNADTLELCGIINPDVIDVQTGWNMVGAFEFDLPVSQITTTPPGIIVSNFFGFNNGYQTASSLQTGKGYWVKVNNNGQLIYNRLQKRTGTEIYLDASSDWGKIIIKDKNGSITTLLIADKSADLTFYELPPVPPAGVFDVRFSTSKIAEKIDTPKDILFNSAQYPIVLRVEGTSVKVKDKIDGKRVNKLLKSGEELIITDPNINVIEVVSELIPDKFELSQNYPNPFNPSTTIRFALPVDSKVKISLFNILGELVADITNQEYDAGYHQATFTAKSLASGVYFYRIEAGKFIDVKKLILLK